MSCVAACDDLRVNRILHVLSVLGVIAVPVVGWFTQDWSGGTTLAVYWFETLAASLFIVARIGLHRRWSPRRGHFRYNGPGNEGGGGKALSTFMSSFTAVSLSFCAAHAVFLGAILLLLDHNGVGHLAQVNWRSACFGCISVLAFLTLSFVVDLFSLRRWTFRRLEQTASKVLSRVMVVHLTLLIGFVAIAITDAPDTFFGVFVVLKTMASLSTALPQWEPAQPPKWLSNVLNRVPSAKPGKRFEEAWADERTEERQRLEANERVWTPGRR